MRIDKYLKVSRILKRRTLAQEATNSGRILINDKVVKSSHQVKVGDVIEVKFNSGAIKFRVLDVKETVKKEQVESLYEIIGE